MLNDEYGQNITPIKMLHATAIIMQIEKPTRGRNNTMLLNTYSSLSSVVNSEQQMNESINYFYNFTKDDRPNVNIGGDVNVWSELIGSDSKKLTSYPDKFKRGENIMHTLAAQDVANMNSDGPTLWEQTKHDRFKEHYVDTP